MVRRGSQGHRKPEYRCSLGNIEDSQDNELDAIFGDNSRKTVGQLQEQELAPSDRQEGTQPLSQDSLLTCTNVLVRP